ncbi:MAG: MBL fold metallo-hydrolase [Myxococcota bacterium]|jgi:glyoxylase-like metal-dependent hydrolase (beta-lactamase superfamily II)|nr:MBL fold metallo-hydrolase [Myxococcota bacterium]
MSTRTIDCQFAGRPELAAAYLLTSGDQAAFFDTNTAHAVPHLLAALAEAGLRPEQVRWIAVSHVHLDHGSGAARLAACCPDATVVCHPRAARHLSDPSRLEQSARAVYGDEVFLQVYGSLQPIPEARVRPVAEGEVLSLGDRSLRVLHTRGHANHHLCLHDEVRRELFTGDAFGLCYPFLQEGRLPLVSSSPTDFDPAAARETLARLVGTGATRALLAHFGAIGELPAVASSLAAQLDDLEALLNEAIGLATDDGFEAFCLARIDRIFDRAAQRAGLTLTPADRDFLRFDGRLDAQGVALAARRRREGGRT